MLSSLPKTKEIGLVRRPGLLASNNCFFSWMIVAKKLIYKIKRKQFVL